MTVPLSPVRWAETAHLDSAQRDCVTAVVLKVLDAKCKMAPGQQEAMLAIYDTLGADGGGLFDQAVHQSIEQARSSPHLEASLRERIHQLRLEAEARIAKPTMKAFKVRLRRELFEPDA